MCIPSLITLNFYGKVFKLGLIFFCNGNFGFLSKYRLQAMPPPSSIFSTTQDSQPDFNSFNLF